MNRRREAFVVILLVSVFSLLPLNASAQATDQAPPLPQRLNLEMAMEILLEANPTILRERKNVAIARGEVIQARLLPNPSFGLNSESFPLFESDPGPFFDRQELSVRVEQPILTAGKRRKRTRVAEQDVAVAQARLQDTIRQVKLELKRRYYAVVLAKAEYELAREILDRFDEIIRLNEARYRQGEVSGLALTRVQTEKLRFFNDVVAAEVNLENTKVALLELLGVRDMTVDFEVTEHLEYEPLHLSLASLQEQALQARADLIAQNRRVERGLRQLDFERALAVPDVIPFFGYKRDFGEDAVVFGVNLELPIFDRNQGGIARSQATIEQELQEQRRIMLAVRRDVQQAYQLVQAQARRVQALEATYVQTARRTRDISQASYRLGALNLIDFLDAERAYRETLRGYYQALYDHQLSIFLLEAAVAKEF